MSNASPIGRDLQVEHVNDLTEAGLELVAEQRDFGVKRMQKLRLIATLEEADTIERERARHRVDVAREELRDATEDQQRLEEICEQRRACWAEILELEEEDERAIDESARQLAVKGTKAGFAYLHPDLVHPGRVVAERKQRRENSAASAEEVR